MKQYLEMLQHLLEHGEDRPDRTGTGTRGVFIYQMKFDLMKGFPLLTTKKVYTKAIIHELLWFLRGDTNIRYLVQNGVTIWSDWPLKRYLQSVRGTTIPVPNTPEWKSLMDAFNKDIVENDAFARDWGDCGPIYGYQWRKWPDASAEGFIRPVDQIANLINDLKTNAYSRRMIVCAWNPPLIPEMVKSGLPPCHTLWQCYVSELSNEDADSMGYTAENKPKRLSLHLYARSIDSFLGLPFNIASYAMLLTMLGRVTGMVPGTLGISFGDLHLYKNHFDQAREQLTREPRPLPALMLPIKQRLEDYVYEDFEILDYYPHPPIKAPIAV